MRFKKKFWQALLIYAVIMIQQLFVLEDRAPAKITSSFLQQKF